MDKRKLIVVVESPDGTTFRQQIEFIKDIKTSIKEAKRIFGKGYWICDWYWE